MKLVFMGTPDFAVGTLQEIVKAGHEVAGVVTQPDRPKGRGKTLQPTPVKAAAQELGLTVYQPKSIIPPHGCLNVHASLLPKYRGAAPVQWAVLCGEKESGVTVMRMDEGLDTGDMLAKESVPLEPDETGGSLFGKLSALGARLLAETLGELEKGKLTAESQPADSPTPYAAMIQKSMGCIDWQKDAKEIERLTRGLDPWPGTFTHFKGKTLKIFKVRVCSQNAWESCKEAVPGQVVDANAEGIYVKCCQDCLRIEELQLEGKKRMQAADFLRGCRIEAGDILG